jgi:hypothetical protein
MTANRGQRGEQADVLAFAVLATLAVKKRGTRLG